MEMKTEKEIYILSLIGLVCNGIVFGTIAGAVSARGSINGFEVFFLVLNIPTFISNVKHMSR